MIGRTAKPAIGRRTLLGATGGLMLAAPAVRAPAVHAQGGNAGVALVIGNSKYQWEASLPNVKRDVADVARSFQALGLRTELLQDLNRAAMVQALDKLKTTSKGANFAALYFAGHGVVTGDKPADFANNFVPVDADLSTPAGVKGVLTQYTDVMPALGGAAHSLAVFDACRNNPADGWRNRFVSLLAGQGSSDHAQSRTYPPNTLLMFSTAPGYAAPDGPAGQNSPFAAAFLRQLSVPPVDLLTLPHNLRRDLLLASQGRQLAFSQSNYSRSFVLSGQGTSMPSASYNQASIVELPNAYALARQASLPLSGGLVGYRAPGAPESRMVGTFRYEASGGPALLIVLSAAGGQADAIYAQRGIGAGGASRWRYVRAAVSGGKITFPSPDEQLNNTFQLSDANAGTWTGLPAHRGTPVSSRLTRID